MQETHSTNETDIQWKNEWGAEIITSHGSSNARGVAVLIKNGFDCTIHQKILDPLGRFIILKADIKDKTYVLREHPSENHAVLKYGSTSTLSDFAQILCRATL